MINDCTITKRDGRHNEMAVISKVLAAFVGAQPKDNPIIQTPLELQQQLIILFRPQIHKYLGHRHAMLNSILHDEIEKEKVLMLDIKKLWQEKKDRLLATDSECSWDLGHRSCPIVGHFSITDRNEIEPPKKIPINTYEVVQQMLCSLDYLIKDIEDAIELRKLLSADPNWCANTLKDFISVQEEYVRYSVATDMTERNYSRSKSETKKHIKYHREQIESNIIYQLSIAYKNNPGEFALRIASTQGCSKESLWNYLHSKLILETLDPTFGGEIWLKPSWKNKLDVVDCIIQESFVFLTNMKCSTSNSVCVIYDGLTQNDIAVTNAFSEFVEYYNSKTTADNQIASKTISNVKNNIPEIIYNMANVFIKTRKQTYIA